MYPFVSKFFIARLMRFHLLARVILGGGNDLIAFEKCVVAFLTL